MTFFVLDLQVVDMLCVEGTEILGTRGVGGQEIVTRACFGGMTSCTLCGEKDRLRGCRSARRQYYSDK